MSEPCIKECAVVRPKQSRNVPRPGNSRAIRRPAAIRVVKRAEKC